MKRGFLLGAPGGVAALLALALLPYSVVASAPKADRPSQAARPRAHVWPFEKSDVPLDAGWVYGRLPNGMAYLIRHAELPKGHVMVRLRFGAGSLDETDDERGYAHFVEHMAFEGSTHVPSGEMVRLLERHGLAFGADTNAFTNASSTMYKLDLPRNDTELVDTALMLMRETASELTFPEEQVSRERGVVLSEMRVRDGVAARNGQAATEFFYPASRLVERRPIGTTERLNAANAASLRGFWQRNYVPAKATLVVVGDIDPAGIEAKITTQFGSWKASPSPAQPAAGPFVLPDPPNAPERTAVYLDPTLVEHITLSQTIPVKYRNDTMARREHYLLANIGVAIVNRRLQKLARQAEPPFSGARLSTATLFREARETDLTVDAMLGQWRRAMMAAVEEYRRAVEQGFSQSEIDEQMANIHTGFEDAAVSAQTRSSAALADEALSASATGTVPANPVAMLGWLNRLAPAITPKSVLDALREEASPLDHPAIRYSGKAAPLGGEAALIRVFAEARTAKLPKIAPVQTAKFAYTDFGQPGYVVEDKREPLLGVRQVRFANSLRLNLKHTDLVKDQILVHLAVDGGRMLATRDNPLAVELVPLMGAAGLGKHSNDELQSILAGHVVGRGIGAGEESFLMRQLTRREDLELQLQLMTAQLTDPGYRPEAERDYRARINAEFARARSTPGGALGLGLGGILSDNDPRFTVPSPEVLKGLTFAKLRQDISDRLAHGAIEMGIVGDIDEDATIALVARTLGALPAREAEPRPYTQERLRSFTTNTAPRTLTHEGPADQALIHIVWRTRDDRDPVEKQALNMMDRVLRIMLTETLRQKLGKTYSTSAGSAPSRVWTDYGIFSIDVPVNVADVAVARAATFEAVGALRDAPPSDDMMLRARAPLLETLDSTLKTNLGWLAQAEQAQSKPGEIERQLKAAERLRAVTPAQVQAEARKYLAQANAVVVTVLPNSPPPTLPLAKPSEAKPSEAKPAPAP